MYVIMYVILIHKYTRLLYLLGVQIWQPVASQQTEQAKGVMLRIIYDTATIS